MMNRWVSYSPQAKLYGNSLAKFLSVAYPVVQHKLVQRFCPKHNVSRPPTVVELAPPAMRVTDKAEVRKQEPKKDKEERQNKKTETRDAVPLAEMVLADVGDTEVQETKSAPAADAPPAAEATSTTTDDDIGGQNAIEKSLLEEIESETGGAAASQEEQSTPGVDSSCEEKTTVVATSAEGEDSTPSTDFTM